MGIKFNQDDLARMLQPEAGWQLGKIVEVKEEISKDKQSLNYVFSFEIIKSATNDKNVGRHFTHRFNSKAMGFIAEMLAAIWNLSKEKAVEKIATMIEKDEELDPKSFIGTEVWNELQDGVYNNRAVVQSSDNWCYGEGEPPF